MSSRVVMHVRFEYWHWFKKTGKTMIKIKRKSFTAAPEKTLA